MKKIAVVVQRCGAEIVGGSEGYAFTMAECLSRDFDVDIITTTAKDYITWENFYNEGPETVSDTLRILRFRVDFQRDSYWHNLSRLLFKNLAIDKFSTLDAEDKKTFLAELEKSPLGLQEEWVRLEGPYSSGLIEHIRKKNDEYDAFVFVTYLYPTTYFAIDAVTEREKIFIVPTLHDEPPAHLPIFRKYSAMRQVFLTGAEKAFAENDLNWRGQSDLIGFGLEDRFEGVKKSSGRGQEKYILYAGRLDEAKGIKKLFEYFGRFSKTHDGLKLYTIGDGEFKTHKQAGVEYLGFVSEEEKLSLMRDALVLVNPSAYESLGIALLESFMMETPALVNAKCAVMKDHIEVSGGGYAYGSYDEFEEALERLMEDPALKRRLGRKGREYFLEHYCLEKYKERLCALFGPASGVTKKEIPAPSFKRELSAVP
ncbi:MAG: glycosyltransferase family 4 protein [Thermodesulfobacteriota bacterium]|nr:MAG: glycosyltransferase family 4 protein [Thermodesulfobacteriota bacterium]